MIYLFEDRIQRMEQYLHQEIDSAFLVRDRVLDCSKESLSSVIDSSYSDAVCVIIHNSYIFPGADVTPDIVRAAFNERGIPVVFFSGDFASNTLHPQNGICNANMRSISLYENLPSFVEEYSKEGTVSIPFLAFGPNYLLNTLLKFQSTVKDILICTDDGEIIDDDEKDEILDEVATIKEPELQEDKQILVSMLYDSNVTVSQFNSLVQSIISKVSR